MPQFLESHEGICKADDGRREAFLGGRLASLLSLTVVYGAIRLQPSLLGPVGTGSDQCVRVRPAHHMENGIVGCAEDPTKIGLFRALWGLAGKEFRLIQQVPWLQAAAS
jgi:hypothetical protein